MIFNTAVFIDLENLLKGYKCTENQAAALSLKSILNSIREAVKGTGLIEGIVLKRAYANWCHKLLRNLRAEISELGGEPVQVFGFSRHNKKNAADIQLAIDATELLATRPSVTTYIIISGDGGFAPLARKLHEYGKCVIGCSYPDQSNQYLRSVCDYFVAIQRPREETTERPSANPSSNGRPVNAPANNGAHSSIEPRNTRLIHEVKPLGASWSGVEVIDKGRQVLCWYANDPGSQAELHGGGMVLSTYQQAINQLAPEFSLQPLGFVKFVEFAQHTSSETGLCVARKPDGQTCLLKRGAVPKEWTSLPDFEPCDPTSLEGHRRILGTGDPVLKLQELEPLPALLNWLVANPPEQRERKAIIDDAVAALNGAMSLQAIRTTLQSLKDARAFESDDEMTCGPETRGVEPRWTLVGDVRSPAALIGLLRQAARNKLARMKIEVNEDHIQQLFPSIS